MSHLRHEKISIRELHEQTGRRVRESADEPCLVTDHGRPVAVLTRVDGKLMEGVALPRDCWKTYKPPVSSGDTTQHIREDRNRRR